MSPDEFARYLSAKESVDDRSLHRPTLDRLAAQLPRNTPLRVIDVGAGLGSMLRRLLELGVLPAEIEYVAVDRERVLLDRAVSLTAAWAREEGYAVDCAAGRIADRDATELRLRREDGPFAAPAESEVRAIFVPGDALAVAPDLGTVDLLVACAFMDIVDPDRALSRLFECVPGGLCYFPITFDGVTEFAPVVDPARQRAVLSAFHATMDAPDRPGGSRSGRALLDAIPAHGGRVLASGGSDWVVTPPYDAGEETFLSYVIDTVERAVNRWIDGETGPLGGRVRNEDALRSGDRLRVDDVSAWADERRTAVADGSLTYLAHNLDLLCRAP